MFGRCFVDTASNPSAQKFRLGLQPVKTIRVCVPRERESVCVCVCESVCGRERETARVRARVHTHTHTHRERERERHTHTHTDTHTHTHVWSCNTESASPKKNVRLPQKEASKKQIRDSERGAGETAMTAMSTTRALLAISINLICINDTILCDWPSVSPIPLRGAFAGYPLPLCCSGGHPNTEGSTTHAQHDANTSQSRHATRHMQ